MRRQNEFCTLSRPIAGQTLKGSPVLPKEIAGIRIPDSKTCREAADLARTAEGAEVFNHSLRSFLFAELIGKKRGLKADSELLFIANIMHDIGLAPKYRSKKWRFEVDGANAAKDFLHARGFSPGDQETVWDSIALHSSGSIARWKRSEVALSNAGIVTDVHGVYLDGLDADAIRAILKQVPRTNFASAFLDALAEIARDKPESTANTFVADVGYRMVPGFHLSNFVDDMRGDDPFAAFAAKRP